MNNQKTELVRKKIKHNNFSQSKIIAKSTFNDVNRISTIPAGTIVPASEDNPGTNLVELLNHMNETRPQPSEEQDKKQDEKHEEDEKSSNCD